VKNLIRLICIVSVILVLCACSSTRVTITADPSDNYQKLGHVEGSSCGNHLLSWPPLCFIPIGLNERYKSAYKDALSKAPGAIGLIDVTMSEDWYWWVIGTARCVTITAEAIK